MSSKTRMTLRNRGEPAGFPVVRAAMRRVNEADLRRLKALLENPPLVSTVFAIEGVWSSSDAATVLTPADKAIR